MDAVDLAQPVDKERIYYPVAQQSRPTMAIVQTAVEPSRWSSPRLRQAVTEIDVEQPIAMVRTMDEWVSRSTITRRAPTLLFTTFAGVALLLAAIGTYGVLAFGVAERTELGVRQAIGADRAAILSLILRQGLRRAGCGVAAGLAGALALSRLLRSLLYEVAPTDPTVMAASTMLLLIATTAACLVPAWRATRMAPCDALREG